MNQRCSLAVVTIIAGLLLTIALPRPVAAGEYHHGTTLICSDCHTMHYSLQHSYTGGAPPPLGTGGPFPNLLKYSPNDLCKSCHDAQTFAPDVVGANTGTDVREAGALTTGTAPYDEWKGHALGSTATAPGGTFSNADGLECVDCHQPHGYAGHNTKDVAGNPVTNAYRNLAAKGGLDVSYAKGTNDTTKDVFLRSWTLGDISTNYDVSNVDLNEPNLHDSGIGEWCKGCHTNFHGKQGDANMGGVGDTEWLRHPTADAYIGAVGGGHSSLAVFTGRNYRVKVMSATGDWGTQGQAWTTATASDDLAPTCTTCHKAHGNQNPFGLVFLSGTGPITEEGDTAGVNLGMKSLCEQCHVQ